MIASNMQSKIYRWSLLWTLNKVLFYVSACFIALYFLLRGHLYSQQFVFQAILVSMKNINLVESPVSGSIEKQYSKQGAMIEADQELVSIALDDDMWYMDLRGNDEIKNIQAQLLTLDTQLQESPMRIGGDLKEYLGKHLKEDAKTLESTGAKIAELSKALIKAKEKIKQEEARKKEIVEYVRKVQDDILSLEPGVYAGAIPRSEIDTLEEKRIKLEKQLAEANKALQDLEETHDKIQSNINDKNMNFISNLKKKKKNLISQFENLGIDVSGVKSNSRVITIKSPVSAKIKWASEHDIGDDVFVGQKLYEFDTVKYRLTVSFDFTEKPSLLENFEEVEAGMMAKIHLTQSHHINAEIESIENRNFLDKTIFDMALLVDEVIPHEKMGQNINIALQTSTHHHAEKAE